MSLNLSSKFSATKIDPLFRDEVCDSFLVVPAPLTKTTVVSEIFTSDADDIL